MLNKEIYFLGKLNQSRDFIFSNNLQENDKRFWDSWFGRCSGQNRLIPFVKIKMSRPRLWLFYIKLPELIYIGLGAYSTDLSGRSYPFILFSRHTPDSKVEDLERQLKLFCTNTGTFRNILNNGKCLLGDYFNLDKNLQDFSLPAMLPQNKLLENGIGGFWLECESGYCLEYEGLPTCSLFNKLFG